ncbi:MAG: nucleotidyltransferase family protein [Candidatus Hodarchaeales archaeon]
MLTKKKIIDFLEAEMPFLMEAYNVNTIGLFGSYAREEQTETSDLDLLIEFTKPISYFTLFKLEDYISDKLGINAEIVTPDGLKELIKPIIMREVLYVE